jgi:DNA-binding MarR family transcriptional regulator
MTALLPRAYKIFVEIVDKRGPLAYMISSIYPIMGTYSRTGMDSDFSDRQHDRFAALSEALFPWQTILNLSQVLALVAIARTPGLSVNELAVVLGLPQQTVSRHVAILLGRYQTTAETSQAGVTTFIRQEISASDPRSRALFLSDDGLALLRLLTADAPSADPFSLATKPGSIQ